MGLTAIRASDVPDDAEQAVRPEPLQGGITGVVWRDFKPGGGVPGEVESDELGLPGVTVELRDDAGSVVAKAKTEADGTFAFDERRGGRVPRSDQRFDVRHPLRRGLVARSEADHAGDHDRLHLGLGRLLDGRHRGGHGCDPAGLAGGCADRRRQRVAGLQARHHPAAGARPHRRLHHDADLRAQGLRHRDRRRSWIGAGRRERDRARHVAHVVRRRTATSGSGRRSRCSSSSSSSRCSR